MESTTPTAQVVTTTEATLITNVKTMAKEILTGVNGTFDIDDVEDYGCAGRGIFDPFIRTEGKHLDEADQTFYKWKKCIQCAAAYLATPTVMPYIYDKDTDSCGKFINHDESFISH